MSQSPKRPCSEVFPVAKHIVERLAPYCERIEIAGSLRRGREMVGDIEIVALPRLIHNLVGDVVGSHLDNFLHESGVDFTKNGDLYKQFAYGKYTVDLFLPASPSHWGSIFMIRTGSNEFNRWIMQEAGPSAGVRFNKGLVYLGGQLLNTSEESDVFEALGLPWVPPNYRDENKWLECIEKAHVV